MPMRYPQFSLFSAEKTPRSYRRLSGFGIYSTTRQWTQFCRLQLSSPLHSVWSILWQERSVIEYFAEQSLQVVVRHNIHFPLHHWSLFASWASLFKIIWYWRSCESLRCVFLYRLAAVLGGSIRAEPLMSKFAARCSKMFPVNFSGILELDLGISSVRFFFVLIIFRVILVGRPLWLTFFYCCIHIWNWVVISFIIHSRSSNKLIVTIVWQFPHQLQISLHQISLQL